MRPFACLLTALCLHAFGCGDDDASTDAGRDASRPDAAPTDATAPDAPFDAATDARDDRPDADTPDADTPDAGPPPRCPAGSDALVLDLDGVSLTRVPGVPIEDGFAAGFSIVEGPVFFDGALHVSHFAGGSTPASRVYRVAADGTVSIAFSAAGTNGLALAPDGSLHGASHVQGAVVRFGGPDEVPTPVVTGYEGTRFNTPNDLVFRSDGQIYLSDPDWQAPSPRPQAEERAYRVDLEGRVSVIPSPPSKPNGVALSLDERTLFVTGQNGMRRYSLDASGAIVGGPTNVDAVSGGLDGIGRDCAGNLYVTGGGRVTILDRDLARVGELAAPGATNAAFGGPDGRTLYVTALGDARGVYSARLNVPGLPD